MCSNLSKSSRACIEACTHTVIFLFLLESQWPPPTYRAVDCVSLQAWLGWRRLGWGRAGLPIRPMSQSGNIKRAANPHLAPITVSCPSHRPISSHYRPMWIPGKFLRPNLFNPIVPIWPGSFSVSLITVINKKTKYWMIMSTTSVKHWYVSLYLNKCYAFISHFQYSPNSPYGKCERFFSSSQIKMSF